MSGWRALPECHAWTRLCSFISCQHSVKRLIILRNCVCLWSHFHPRWERRPMSPRVHRVLLPKDRRRLTQLLPSTVEVRSWYIVMINCQIIFVHLGFPSLVGSPTISHTHTDTHSYSFQVNGQCWLCVTSSPVVWWCSLSRPRSCWVLQRRETEEEEEVH